MVNRLKGQSVLEGMPVPTTFDGNLHRRNALARTLTPAYWGIEPDAYDDITPAMRYAAEPYRLVQSLVDVPPDSPCAVSYLPGNAHRAGYVAFTPTEYSMIVRSPAAFTAATRNRTLQSRPVGDVHSLAADRSVKHAHSAKKETAETYLHNTLEPWNELLAKFNKASRYPGLSLMGSELSMRTNFESLRTNILGNMLDALRVQRDWNDKQAEFARRTIEDRMIIDREHNQHITYFAGIVAVSQFYFGHKTALFRDRIYASKRITQQLE